MQLMAHIPAKGTSTRIPKKNMVEFFGKPLLSYTIEAAIAAGVFQDIVVSSEDDEISRISSEYKEITFVRRPEALSSASASVLDVSNFVLDKVGEDYEYVFILLPTTPMRTATDIKDVSTLLGEKRPDSIISVTDFFFPPIYSYVLEENNGKLTRAFPDLAQKKTQEAPRFVVDNGGIYALKPECIRNKIYCTDDTLPYHMPLWKSIDIDSTEDLEIAKAMYTYFVKGS